MKSIYFFGDSICFGQYMSPHKTWVNRISQELSKFDDDILVQNVSHSGDTTRMALEKMPFEVQSHDVDLIYIQFGINDSNLWQSDHGLPRVSEKAFESNLHEIITRSKSVCAKKIFLATNHPITKAFTLDGKRVSLLVESAKYNMVIRKVAEEHKVQLIDIESWFVAKIIEDYSFDDFLLEDKVHLNQRGHDLYFDVVFQFIKREMEKL